MRLHVSRVYMCIRVPCECDVSVFVHALRVTCAIGAVLHQLQLAFQNQLTRPHSPIR